MFERGRPVARALIAATLGAKRARDLMVQARHLPSAPRLALVEAAEVRRAQRLLPATPTAHVVTIMPTYGRRALLLDAITSALAQTVPDHAIVVVVDGGPTPSLPDDPRVHVVRLGTHRGIPGLVRNVGIRVSSSAYLAFLDDDNSWEPHHLEVSLAAHRAGAGLTYTGLRQVHLDGTTGDVIAVPFDRKRLRNHGYIDTSTMVVRRSPAVRFSRAPRGGSGAYEDWNLAFRLSRRLRTELVPDVTVRYLIHAEGYMQRHL